MGNSWDIFAPEVNEHHFKIMEEENKAVEILGISEGIFLEFTNHSLQLSHIAVL